jgi:hypothetical protein
VCPRADEGVEGRRRELGPERSVASRTRTSADGAADIQRSQDLAQRQLSLRQKELPAGQRVDARVDAPAPGGDLL